MLDEVRITNQNIKLILTENMFFIHFTLHNLPQLALIVMPQSKQYYCHLFHTVTIRNAAN